MSAVLEARRLAKSYAGQAVLNDASLSVAPGEFVAILGESGAGKTTLFRCLTLLTEPDAGEIVLAGSDLMSQRGRRLRQARRQIGVVFQQFNLVRRLSALDNVLAGRLDTTPLWRVMIGRFALADVELAWRALSAVGLTDQAHQRADTLSGGQQQRVAIARALAQDSRVILADEPVASLDPASAQAILQLLKTLCRERGLAVVCTLHQPELAARYADRVLTMRAGRLEADPPKVLQQISPASRKLA